MDRMVEIEITEALESGLKAKGIDLEDYEIRII